MLEFLITRSEVPAAVLEVAVSPVFRDVAWFAEATVRVDVPEAVLVLGVLNDDAPDATADAI